MLDTISIPNLQYDVDTINTPQPHSYGKMGRGERVGLLHKRGEGVAAVQEEWVWLSDEEGGDIQ